MPSKVSPAVLAGAMLSPDRDLVENIANDQTGFIVTDLVTGGGAAELPTDSESVWFIASAPAVVPPAAPAIVTGATTTPASGSTIHIGQHIEIDITLSDAVTVTGSPTLKMSDGGTATMTGWTGNTLEFDYLPKSGEQVADLKVASVVLPAGSAIKDLTGAAANLTAAKNLDLHLAVDTIAPTVSKLASLNGTTHLPLNPAVGLAQNDDVTFSLTFNEAITATGTPELELSNGATATYTGGSGTETLTFDYHVGAEGSTDLKIIGYDGTMSDAAGNPLGALNLDTKLKVNAFSWATAHDGIWSDPSEWTGKQVPDSLSAAFINATGKAYTVTAFGLTTNIGSLSVGSGATFHARQATATGFTGMFTVAFDVTNAGTIKTGYAPVSAFQFGIVDFSIGTGDVDASTFTNKGTVNLDSNFFLIGDILTLTGGGTVNLLHSFGAGPAIQNAKDGDATLINVDNRIVGSSELFGADYLKSGHSFTLINQAKGVIEANTLPPLIIGATGGVQNAGTLKGAAGGGPSGLFLHTDVENSGLIEALSTGKVTDARVVIENDVTVTNTSKGVILASGVGAHVDIIDSTIVGGTLKTTGGSGPTAAVIYASGSTFDGSQAANPVNVAALVNVGSLTLKGAINNTGTLSLPFGALCAEGDTTLSGTGKVILGNSGVSTISNAAGKDATLTNVSNTIVGPGMIQDHASGGMFTLINQAKGVINASDTLTALTVSPDLVQNFGILEATSAKGLIFQDTTIANSNLIEALAPAKGGALVLIDGSTINNTSKGVVLASGADAHVDLRDGATIVGGTLKAMGGTGGSAAAINVVNYAVFDGSQALNPLNQTARVNVKDAAELDLKGTINNTGTIVVGHNATILLADADPVTLNGTGSMLLNKIDEIAAYGVAGTFINNGNAISGSGMIGDMHTDVFNNKGSMTASGGTLDIEAKSFQNGSILAAIGSGTLRIETDIQNTSAGVVQTMAANAHIVLDDADITGGKVSIFKGSSLDSISGDNTITAAVVNNGNIDVQRSYSTIADVQRNHLTITGAVTGTGTATVGGDAMTGTPTLTTIDNPAATLNNFVFGINNHGDIIGTYRLTSDAYKGGNPPYHGYVMHHGKFTELADVNAKSTLDSGDVFPTQPRFIDDAGEVFGNWFTVNGSAFGSFRYDGTIHELASGDVPKLVSPNGTKFFGTLSHPSAGSSGTVATAMNDSGTIVGYYFDDDIHAHGFIYDGTSYQTLDNALTVFSDFGTGTFLTGINNHGQIVGYYTSASGFSAYHSFIYDPRLFMIKPLPDPDNTAKAAVQAINDAGQIIGSYVGKDGHTHSFLADAQNGVLEFGAASSTSVTFTGNGTLMLDTATSTANKFTGKISGFDHTDDIVLGAIDYDAGTTKITQSFANSKGGTVTVTDAAHHSITLTFVGDYRSETFVIQDDLSGNHHVDLVLA